MFFCATALASFRKPRLLWKKSRSKNMQTLTLENRISNPRKSCFGPPGVGEPPVGNHFDSVWLHSVSQIFLKWIAKIGLLQTKKISRISAVLCQWRKDTHCVLFKRRVLSVQNAWCYLNHFGTLEPLCAGSKGRHRKQQCSKQLLSCHALQKSGSWQKQHFWRKHRLCCLPELGPLRERFLDGRPTSGSIAS